MALQDFTIPGSIDPTSSPDDVKRRMAMAEALTKQGGETTPVVGWTGVLARALQGGLGGYQRGQAQQEEQQGRSSYQQQLANALTGNNGNVSSQDMIRLAGNPWANPSQTRAITHVADMQAQKARQGVEDSHWAASYALQKHASERADDKTPAGFMADPAHLGQYIPITGGPADPNYVASVNSAKGSDLPPSVKEWQFYTKNFQPTAEQPAPMPYETWATAKARAAATNVTTNVDTKGPDKYDSMIGEGIAKSHSAIMGGVEDAQSRARDIAAMQGAVDAIQKNGGTTGGLAPAARLELQKSINAGANALGIDKPFNEADLSDKEFLTKFNRSMAGAQAKNAVGSRVTNFEMSNFLKANPGLDMSLTGNQRLLGIQAQMEQRNIKVGNLMRDEATKAVGAGQKVNPAAMEKIIRDYDAANHIKDPITGQDLTQSYTLPEFQNSGTNPALAAGHETNVKKIRRYNPVTNAIE